MWSGFMIACCYELMIAWCMVYWCNSFRAENGHLAWCSGDTDTPCDPAARGFLFDKVIHLGSPKYDNGDVRRSTNIVPQTLLALCVSWVLIYLSVLQGRQDNWKDHLLHDDALHGVRHLLFFLDFTRVEMTESGSTSGGGTPTKSQEPRLGEVLGSIMHVSAASTGVHVCVGAPLHVSSVCATT